METNIMTRSLSVEEASDHVLDDDPEHDPVAFPSPAPVFSTSLEYRAKSSERRCDPAVFSTNRLHNDAPECLLKHRKQSRNRLHPKGVERG